MQIAHVEAFSGFDSLDFEVKREFVISDPDTATAFKKRFGNRLFVQKSRRGHAQIFYYKLSILKYDRCMLPRNRGLIQNYITIR